MSSKANCGCGGRLGVEEGVVDAVRVLAVTVGVTLVRGGGGIGGSGWGVGMDWGGGGRVSGLLTDSWASRLFSRLPSFRYEPGFSSYRTY